MSIRQQPEIEPDVTLAINWTLSAHLPKHVTVSKGALPSLSIFILMVTLYKSLSCYTIAILKLRPIEMGNVGSCYDTIF